MKVLLGYRAECYKYKGVCNLPKLYKHLFLGKWGGIIGLLLSGGGGN